MNIVGLSEATLEPIIAHGFIHELSDLFSLSTYKEEMKSWEGFGDKKVSNILAAIKEKKEIPFQNLLSSLGIVNVGHHVAKLFDTFAKKYPDIKKTTLFEKIWTKSPESIAFSEVSGIGEVIVKSIQEYFENEKNVTEYNNLLSVLTITDDNVVLTENTFQSSVAGKRFVVTGAVTHFKNRKQLTQDIEEKGGKVSGSVSKNTDYLINNDAASTSGKNKKAKELGIPIITEEEYLKL